MLVAQDIIQKVNNEEISCIVTEINQTHIKYKLLSDTTGSELLINKQEVRLIMFRNGHNEIINHEAYNPAAVVKKMPKEPEEKEYTGIFWVHGLDAVIARAHLSYEGVSPDKKRGYMFGAMYGFLFKRVELQTQYNWYTKSLSGFRYYAGPRISGGRRPTTSAHLTGYWWFVPGNYVTLSFQNGFTFDHSDLLRLSFGGGFGVRYFMDVSRGLYGKYTGQTFSNPDKKLILFHVNCSLNIGFKF